MSKPEEDIVEAADVVDLVEDKHAGATERVEFLVEDIEDPLLGVAGDADGSLIWPSQICGNLEGHTHHRFSNLARVSIREVVVTNLKQGGHRRFTNSAPSQKGRSQTHSRDTHHRFSNSSRLEGGSKIQRGSYEGT